MQTFFLSPTDPEEIELIIKSLSTNKSTGPANISKSICKIFKLKLKTPLSNLVNLFFECRAFPEILKIASVTPIYKRDDFLISNDCWPIFLLSNISKITEKKFLNDYAFQIRSEKHLIKSYLHVASILTYKKHLTQWIIQFYLTNSTTTVWKESLMTDLKVFWQTKSTSLK